MIHFPLPLLSDKTVIFVRKKREFYLPKGSAFKRNVSSGKKNNRWETPNYKGNT